MCLIRGKLDYTVLEFVRVNMFLGDTLTSHGDSRLMYAAWIAANQRVPGQQRQALGQAAGDQIGIQLIDFAPGQDLVRLIGYDGLNRFRNLEFSKVDGDVALKLTPGSFHFLTGPSGAGRSTAINALEDSNRPGFDDVILTDRFQLGEPRFRGFDIRGVGPRVIRQPYIDDGEGGVIALTERNQVVDDALGGRAYYLGRAELEIPLGTGARELGLRPSIFMGVGALFAVTKPILQDNPNGIQQRDGDGNLLYLEVITDANGNPSTVFSTNAIAADGVTANAPSIIQNSRFREVFLGDSISPRVSIGIGVNWNSPFGPFRIDFAHVLRSQPGDDTKRFTFNVGTQF